MDVEELELFRKSVRRATASASGAALDAALAELGWRDALVTDPRTAVATLFELQGAGRDDVVRARRGPVARARVHGPR